MSEETVIVVSEPEPAAPAAPEYVTPGEMEARLELLRLELRGEVAEVAEVAGDAAVTAEVAASEAESAQVIADVALEVAVEAEQTAETVEETSTEPEVTEDTSGGPKAAQPRAQPAGTGKEKPPSYGAKSIFG